MIADHTYLLQILVFLRNVLVEFFAHDIEEESLAEIVHLMFNLDAHLYTVAMQSAGSTANTLGLLRETTYSKILNDAYITLIKQLQAANSSDDVNQVALSNENPLIIKLNIDQNDLLSNEQKRVIQELPWRQTLKAGDRIDAINKHSSSTNKIIHWSRCTIVRVVENDLSTYALENPLEPSDLSPSRFAQRFQVAFDGQQTDSRRYFDCLSFEIAPYGTFTDNFDWRYELKPGDLVDCADTEGIWYRSTVLKVDEISTADEEFPNARPQKNVLIGYRYYSETEGHKNDDEPPQRKFVGWTNKYDTWLSVTSPVIQPLRTISKFYKVAGKSPMQYDDYIQDGSDVIYNSHSIKQYVMHRDQSSFTKLKFFPDFINDFGDKGGFKKILKLFNGELKEGPLTVKQIFHITDFLAKVNPLFTRQYMIYFTPLLKDAFFRAIMSGPLKQSFNKDHLSGAQTNFTKLLKRFYPWPASGSPVKTMDDNYHLIEGDMIFCVAITLLKSEKLEQRVAGLNQINALVKPSTSYYYNSIQKGLEKSDMLQRIREHNVMDIIFGDKDSHVQLVMRGLDLVKFIVQQKEFSQQYLELVWNAAHRGEEQTKLEIYNIFKELNTQLRAEDIEAIISLFSQIPPEKFIIKELDCVASLISYMHRSTKIAENAIQLCFDIAVQNRPYPKELIEVAIDKIMVIARMAMDQSLRIQLIQQGYQTLSMHKASLQSIRIISKMLDEVPTHRIADYKTKYEVATELIDNLKILDLVIADLKLYNEAANQLWKKGEIKKENIESVELMNLPFTHRSNIANRLSFIKQLLNVSVQDLDAAYLDQIWDILVTNSKITSDQQYFFEWFQGIISERSRVSYDIISNFFETKVCQRTEPGTFSSIMKSGFECIQTMFLTVNEQQENIHITTQVNNFTNQVTKMDFIVHIPPHKLKGIEVMWKILQECDKKNVDVTTAVVDLITKLYHNLSSQLDDQEVLKVHDQFCQECIRQMNIAALNQSTTEDEKKQFIKTAVTMVKTFLYESEKNGMGSLKSHVANDRGEFLEKVILQNMVSQVKTTPRFIEVNTYSNMTVWELKKIASQKFHISPLAIHLQRHDSKKALAQFVDINNHKLLKDLKVESYEIIQVQRKAAVAIPRVKLLNKKNELIPEAKAIFQSWFKMFCNEDGFITEKECVTFIKSTTNTYEANIRPDDQRIKTLFTEFSVSNPGYLTEEEFLNFYTVRAQAKTEAVWSNLTIMKYGNDLRHQQDINNPDDPRELRNIEALPRAKLTSDQELFKELMDLLKILPPSSQEELGSLLTQLRTNPVLYADMLSLKSIDSLSLKNCTNFEILYRLQIIEAFLSEYQTKRNSEIKSYYSEALEGQGSSNNQQQSNFPSINEAYENKTAPAVADQNIAIPLPPASTIPDPPAPKVPFIGPQPPPGHNSNQQQQVAPSQEEAIKKVNELLSTARGHIQQESLSQNLFTDQEIARIIGCPPEHIPILRLNWITSFIQQGGFRQLLHILKDIEDDLKRKKTSPDFMKIKAERECLKQLLNIIKTLLMAGFIANLPSPELSLALSQRLSSNNPNVNQESTEENKDGNKKAAIIQEQENTSKLYAPLIDVMLGETGEQLLKNFEFKDLQHDLFLIMEIIMSKKEFVYDDRAIVETAMNIWISLIVFNQELFQVLINQWNSDSQLVNTSSSSYTKILVINGLLSNQSCFRTIVSQQIKFLAQSVRSKSLSELPYIFFLKVMLTENNKAQKKPRESQQYYQVAFFLLQIYLKEEKKGGQVQIIDHNQLLADYVNKLRAYRSQEEKNRTFYEDYNISGMVRIIQELIQNDSSILSSQDAEAFADEIIIKYLFTIDIKPIDSDITKNVDLSSWEKPFINKCQSLNSRKATFGLLQTLCTHSPHLIPLIIKKYFINLISQVKKPKKAGYQPKLDSRSNNFSGLRNLGSICYMNSMIQQFFAIPAFRYSIMSIKDKAAPNLVDFEGDQINDNLLYQFMKLFSFLELSERSDYNPREFCFSYKDFTGGPTNVREQKDTSEFLSIAFDRLENAIRNTPQKYLLQSVFGGKTCTVTICKGCGNVNTREEDFYNLSITVQNKTSIHDGLKYMVTGETINDYKCDACKNRVDLEKKTVVEKLPNTLIVHLQRIIFDMDTFQNKKLNTRVEFPNVLNMRQYMKDEVLKADTERIEKAKKEKKRREREERQQEMAAQKQKRQTEDGKDGEDADMEQMPNGQGYESEEEQTASDIKDLEMKTEEPPENFEYKLVGIVIHMGTADAGHYLSYINTNKGQSDTDKPEWLQTDKDKWLEFNDSQVKEYRFANLEQDCFGGAAPSTNMQDEIVDYSRNAYMLYYEKRRKEKIKVVVPPELAAQANQQEINGTTVNTLPLEALTSLCPSLSQDKLNSHQLDLTFDQDKQEYLTSIDFNVVEKFVPHSLYELVHKDNHSFLFEKQIYNATFYEAIKNLVQILIEQDAEFFNVDNTDENEGVFEFMEKLIFDVLSMTSENKQLIDIVKVYTQMLHKNSYQTFQLIEKKILKLQSELKDQREFFETMISHIDRDVREMNAIILFNCLNICFKEQNREYIDLIMKNIFSLIPDDLSKNWLKCEQILWVLFELTRSGRAQLLYMMENKLVTKLVDFYLENDSPFVAGPISKKSKRSVMGSNYASPPLGNLILCLSYIVRQQDYVNLQRKNLPLVDMLGNRIKSFLCYNHSGVEVPDLHSDDLYMISQKAFLTKGLQGNYELPEFIRLITHICFNNLSYSRMVAKAVIKGLNRAGGNETFGYITLIAHMIAIPDIYMQERLEWLLGYPALRIEYPKPNENRGIPLKIGIQILKAPDNEFIDYKTPVFNKISGEKDGYLKLLYMYRNRWAKYVLDALIALLQACHQDQTNVLYYYIYTMEAPTPQYARYMDWIRPFLFDTLQTALRNPTLPDSPQEIQLCMQANQLLDQLIRQRPFSGELIQQSEALTQYVQALQQNPDNKKIKRRTIKYDVQKDYGPQQYLIWNIIKEVSSEQQWFETEDGGLVSLNIKEYEVRMTDSQPDGDTNRLFPPQLFPHYKSPFMNFGASKQVNFNIAGYAGESGSTTNGDSANWGRNRNFGRGQNAQYHVTQASEYVTVQKAGNRRNHNKKNKYRPVGIGTRSNQNDENGYDEESHPNQDFEEGFLTDNGEHEPSIKEDNFMDVDNAQAVQGSNFTESVAHINEPLGEGLLDAQRPNYQESQDGPGIATQDLAAALQSQDNNEYSNQGTEEAAIGSNDMTAERDDIPTMTFDNENSEMQAQDQQTEVFNTQHENNNGAVPELLSPQDLPKNNQQEEDQPMFEENKQEQMEEEEDNGQWEGITTIRMYSIMNETNKSQKVNIRLSYSDDLSQVPFRNERILKSWIPGTVQPNKELDYFIMTKLRPFEPFGNIKFEVQVGDLPKDPEPPVPVPPEIGEPEPVNIPQVPEPEPDQISCPGCTFFNSLTATSCEVCGTNLK